MSKTVAKKKIKQRRQPQPVQQKSKLQQLSPQLIQRVMVAPNSLSTGELHQLQGIIGNASVQRLVDGQGGAASAGVIQRLLPDSNALKKLGGKAGHKLRGKSSYKKILEGVDAYNAIDPHEFDRRMEKLEEIGQEIANWFNSPERAKKTGNKKRADERKAEMLTNLMTIVNQEMRNVDQERLEFEEQAHQERLGQIGKMAGTILSGGTTRRMKEAGVQGQTPEELEKSTLTAYGEDMDKILADKVNTEGQKVPGRTPTAFDWRGTTKTTKMASALGEVTGRNYFKTVLLPAFSPIIRVENHDVEIDPVKIEAQETDKPGIIHKNAGRLMGLYGGLMQLFTEDGASSLPELFTIFCAQLYQLALSKGMDEDNAYLLVSSQIFLRTINPMLIGISAAIGRDDPGKVASMYIAKMLQNDANKVKHSTKQAFMAAVDAANYQKQIKTFVKAVIERGEKLVQQD